MSLAAPALAAGALPEAAGAADWRLSPPRPELRLPPREPLDSAFFCAASSAWCFRTCSCCAIWSSRLEKDGTDLGAVSRTRFFSASSLAFFSAARRSSSARRRRSSSALRRRSSSARSASRRFSASMRCFSARSASMRSSSALASASARFSASISAARASRMGLSCLRTMET